MVVVVIGAGVAGLMAAGVAASGGHRVVVLEKMEKPARKLRITGKGRCNITNTKSVDEFLSKVCSGTEFLEYSLRRFDTAATRRFFEAQGLELVVERGDRVFPASSRAGDVANALERWAVRCGAQIRVHAPVAEICAEQGRVTGVRLECGEWLPCDRVIVATGGVSYPSTGSSGDGHQMAYDLGHSIVPLRPALVPLQVDTRVVEPIALRNVEQALLVDGTVIDTRFGDVEFMKQPGVLGGAVTLQLGRQAVDAISEGRQVGLLLDLKPALSPAKLQARIRREISALDSATLKILLQKLVPSALHAHLAHQAALTLRMPVADLSENDIERLVVALKKMQIKVLDYRPFTEAIVTAGGVDLSQIDPHTMRSRLVEGLYMAGELLDLDAATGGYNIQIALSTGHLAGELQ